MKGLFFFRCSMFQVATVTNSRFLEGQLEMRAFHISSTELKAVITLVFGSFLNFRVKNGGAPFYIKTFRIRTFGMKKFGIMNVSHKAFSQNRCILMKICNYIYAKRPLCETSHPRQKRSEVNVCNFLFSGNLLFNSSMKYTIDCFQNFTLSTKLTNG